MWPKGQGEARRSWMVAIRHRLRIKANPEGGRQWLRSSGNEGFKDM